MGKQQRKKTLGRVVSGNLQAMRLEASNILLKAHAGIDEVAERKKAAEELAHMSQLKTLGELVPVYLKVREFGESSGRKLTPASARLSCQRTA